MAIILALIAGIGSILNLYFFGGELILQIFLTLMALAALPLYQGTRTRSSYNHDGTRIYTFGFAIVMLAIVGSVLILVVKMLGFN